MSRILVFIILCFLPANPLYAMSFYWGIHPDKERLVFQFKKKIPLKYKIFKVYNNTVEFKIPYNLFKTEPIPNSRKITDTSIISKVNVNKNGTIIINTKIPNFKIKYFNFYEENKVVIDFIKIPKIKEKKSESVNSKNISINNNSNKKTKNKSNSSVIKNNLNKSINKNSSLMDNKSINNKNDFNGTNNKSKNIKLKKIKYNIDISWKIRGPILKNATIYNPNIIFYEDKNNIKEKKVKNNEFQGYIIRKKIYYNIKLAKSYKNNINIEKNKTVKKEREIISTNKTAITPNLTESKESKNTNNATVKVDYSDKITQIKLQINNGEFETALQDLEILYNDANLPLKYREEVLYYLSDLYLQIYKDKLKENYMKISNVLQDAINLFPKSLYLPIWLLKLCYLNLKVGNVEEARGYFNLLKTKYPKSSYVAQGYYYWGEYYLSKKDYINAMNNFKTIVENYQSSKVVRQSAINLARVLFKMEMYQKSWIVMKYLEQRWPLYYQKAPDILKLNGFVAMFNKKYDLALDYYWKYYNILPKINDADTVLARIGDLYLKKGEKPYAKKIYLYVATKYPDKEGGLIAKMRLAEEGIYDKPDIKSMFSVFDRPYNLRPVKIYTEIVEKHPDSPLAPIAQVKLAIWYLWNKNYINCLKAVKYFEEKFKDNELKNKAEKIGRIALSDIIKKAVKDEMYSYILSMWNKYSFLRKDISKLDPSTVIAVAISLWRTGKPYLGLKLATPYLSAKNKKTNFLSSLELVLNIYLESESWKDIESLGNKFLMDKRLGPQLRSQLKYAYSLAKINLGKGEESVPYLKELAVDNNITEKQRGYVFYFLARQEYEDENFKKVYIYAQEALDIFLRKKINTPKIGDCFDMLIDVTKKSGRVLEAIEWAEKYKKYIPKDSPKWPEFEYMLADLYLKAGYVEKWKKLLSNIRQKYPNTFYGRLASNDLINLDIKQRAKKYIQ